MYNIIKNDRELRSLFWKLIFFLVLMLLVIALAIFAPYICPGHVTAIAIISIGCFLPLLAYNVCCLVHLIIRYSDRKPEISRTILMRSIRKRIPGLASQIKSLIENGVITSAKDFKDVCVESGCDAEQNPLYCLDRTEPVLYGTCNKGGFECISIKANMKRSDRVSKPLPVIFNLFYETTDSNEEPYKILYDICCDKQYDISNLLVKNNNSSKLTIGDILSLLSGKRLTDFGSIGWVQGFKIKANKVMSSVFGSDYKMSPLPSVTFKVAKAESYSSGPKANIRQSSGQAQTIHNQQPL